MKYVLALYLATTFFLLIRNAVLTHRMNKEAKYELAMEKKPIHLFMMSVVEVFYLVFWPIIFLTYPKDFIGAFFLSDRSSFVKLIVHLSMFTGRVVFSIKWFCKNL